MQKAGRHREQEMSERNGRGVLPSGRERGGGTKRIV